MSLNEREYDALARWLDGEDVELTGEQRLAAEEILRDERALGGRLDVAVPPGALARLAGRLEGRRPAPARRLIRIGYAAGALAAAAAVVLLAVTALRDRPDHRPPTPRESYYLTTAEMFPKPTARDEELDLLAGQIDQLAAEIKLSQPKPVLEMSIEALEREIDEFWL